MAKSIKLGSDTYLDASGIVGIRGTVGSTDNLDNYIGREYNGVWIINDASNMTSAPSSYCMLFVMSASSSSGFCSQLCVRGTYMYTRVHSGSPAVWSDWVRYSGFNTDYTVPKLYSFTVANGGSKTIKFSSSETSSGMISFVSAYTVLRGAYVFWAETGGNVRTTVLGTAPEGITLTSSTSGLNIANSNASATANVKVLLYNGTVVSVT